MSEQVKILCVDDENNVLRALRRVFIDDDYEIVSALSAEKGLEILRTDEEIQIVVSDYRMPGVNGVDFLKEVRKNWPDTVRIVLSGYADTAAVVAAINDGQIFKFIPKPWNEDELRTTIQDAVERYNLKISNQKRLDNLEESNLNLQRTNEKLRNSLENSWTNAIREYSWLICQDILNGLPVSVLGIDSAGYIIHCNDMAMDFLEKPEKVLLGSPWHTVLPEAIHPFVEKLIDEGVVSEYLSIGGRKGFINGKKAQLGAKNGLILTIGGNIEERV